jgi:hypothetical protein
MQNAIQSSTSLSDTFEQKMQSPKCHDTMTRHEIQHYFSRLFEISPETLDTNPTEWAIESVRTHPQFAHIFLDLLVSFVHSMLFRITIRWSTG